MRVLLQKVTEARVTVDGRITGETGPGYLLFLGVMQGDTAEQSRFLAEKILKLRLWPGADGTINDRSLMETGGSVLVVSQFTLAGRTEKGNRPDYTQAADRDTAKDLYGKFMADLRSFGVTVACGEFGAMMAVELTNDGPVTLWLER